MFQKKVIPTIPIKELSIVHFHIWEPYHPIQSENEELALKIHYHSVTLIIPTSTNRLSSLLRFKDVIPKELQSNLVYKCLCGKCNVIYSAKLSVIL